MDQLGDNTRRRISKTEKNIQTYNQRTKEALINSFMD